MKKIKIFFLLICLVLPFSLVACENKNKDTLSTPSNLTVENSNIIFNQVKKADYYILSINDMEIVVDATYSQNVQIIDNKIVYNASKIFVVGENYLIKVKASAKEKESSKYSSIFAYEHLGKLNKPKNVKINNTTLTWDTVDNATHYLVKIITPEDTYITSTNGSVLTNVDSHNVKDANLTQFSFHLNKFEFGSLLSKAGSYSFFVCSVNNYPGTYIESEYSEKTTYSHYQKLSSPKAGKVSQIDGDLYITTTIDENASAVRVYCNSDFKEIELNGSQTHIVSKVENNVDNFIKINLSKCFTNLNSYTLSQFIFSTQSISSNTYLTDSTVSNTVIYNKTHKLSAPVLQMQETEDNCVLSWSCLDNNNVSKYNIVLFTGSGLREYPIIDTNITNMIIDEPFTCAAIRAIGSGNIVSSNLSNFVYPSSTTLIHPHFNITGTGSTITWQDIADYYIVEFNDIYTFIDNNSYTFDADNLTQNPISLTVTALKSNYAPSTISITNVYSEQLETPTFSTGQGFNITTPYVLTFTEVQNAIGYYVYVQPKYGEYVKLDKLYTSNTIDLSNELSKNGPYSEYRVKIQAVADPLSIYQNSAYSQELDVVHASALTEPIFATILDANDKEIEAPVEKTINGEYLLKFSHVTGVAQYEILINNYVKIFTVETIYDWYSVDITDYLTSAGNYTIKVRAIPVANSSIEPSKYATTTYIIKQQLNEVKDINISYAEGGYLLYFSNVENAEYYRINIIKLNDNNYDNYLQNLGLSSSFETRFALNISDYLQQPGTYQIYVTALAPRNSTIYSDSNISTNYASISVF